MNKALDRIILTSETAHKIREWCLSNGYLQGRDGKYIIEQKHLKFTDKEYNLPLKEGIFEEIKDGEEAQFHRFSIEDDIINVETTIDDKKMIGAKFNSAYNFKKYGFKELSANYKGEIIETTDSYKVSAAFVSTNIICSLIFMSEFREDKEVISETRVSYIAPNNNQQKQKKKKKRPLKIGIYRINPNFQVTLEKRKYERQAEAWGVRGHWRTYKKSGKRVWIPEHKKGTGEKEGKTYTV